MSDPRPGGGGLRISEIMPIPERVLFTVEGVAQRRYGRMRKRLSGRQLNNQLLAG